MIAVALLAASVVAQTGEPILIHVDDLGYTAGDVKARAAELRARGFAATSEAVAENLVSEALLAAAARHPERVPARLAQVSVAAERQRLLADLYVERALVKRVPVNEEQLRRIFHQSDSVRIRLLLFTSREAAKASMDRLAVSSAWPVEAANAIASSRYTRAELSTVTRALLDPALAEAAFKAPLNQLSGPLELSLGWAVFLVTERDTGSEAQFAAQRASLEAIARQQNAAAIRQHYVEGRRGKVKITVDTAFLQMLGTRMAVTDAEAEHAVATVDGHAIAYAEVTPALRALGALGGHMAGASAKQEMISRFVDERLVAEGALAAGLDKEPEVARLLRRAESRSLANLMADVTRAGKGPRADASARERAIGDLVGELRKHARIQLDAAAIAAAVNG